MGLFDFFSGGGESVTVKELQEILKEKNPKNKFIDVRTKQEFKQGHIDGFINIPLSDLSDTLTRVPKNKTIYLICASGARSASAQRLLQKHDRKAVNIRGGMMAFSRL